MWPYPFVLSKAVKDAKAAEAANTFLKTSDKTKDLLLFFCDELATSLDGKIQIKIKENSVAENLSHKQRRNENILEVQQKRKKNYD